MKLSKLFHSLYFMVMFLPLFIIPIFAININQKSVEPISIEVQEKISVDFNQQVNYTTPYTLNGVTFNNANGTATLNGTTNISNPSYYYISSNINFIQNHKYYYRYTYISGSYTGSLAINTYLINSSSYPIQSFIVTAINNANNYNAYITMYGGATANNWIFNLNIFDLTQMYGSGKEPTMTEFDSIFTEDFYPKIESQKMLVDKPSVTTYNDTDIGSQFLYSLYKPVRDYCNFANYFGLNGVYDWFLMTFFNGTAPLVFFIFFNLMIYWLFISLLWLLFDVLIYVPMMIHRWLDKGALE